MTSLINPRLLRAAAVSAGLAVAGLGGTASSALARTCSAPKYPGNGYFTSLKVTGVSCSSGKKVALAHYRCRVKKGVQGKCSSRVNGMRCTESRPSSGRTPAEYNARVTCKSGSKKVVVTYQQNL